MCHTPGNASLPLDVAGGPLENNQYDWGLCFHEEQSPPSNYCVPDPAWPCAANASYHGRGPIQLSYNYKHAMDSADVRAIEWEPGRPYVASAS